MGAEVEVFHSPQCCEPLAGHLAEAPRTLNRRLTHLSSQSGTVELRGGTGTPLPLAFGFPPQTENPLGLASGVSTKSP